MIVRKHGNTILGANFTAQERKALKIEINRQILEADMHYTNNIDAMILWALHEHLGFGPKRLREFYDAFSKIHDDLRKYYELSEEDGPWISMTKLKEIGVDVEQWNKNKYNQSELQQCKT